MIGPEVGGGGGGGEGSSGGGGATAAASAENERRCWTLGFERRRVVAEEASAATSPIVESEEADRACEELFVRAFFFSLLVREGDETRKLVRVCARRKEDGGWRSGKAR